MEIPFLLIYIILLTYIGASSYLIAYLEEWPIRDGFYFVMMSVLTIGFGGEFFSRFSIFNEKSFFK